MRHAPLSFGLALVFFVASAHDAVSAPRRPHPDEWRPDGTTAVQSYDLGQRIDVNDISMFVTNIGSFAWDLTTGAAGLEFPKGSGKTAVFAGGLWLGAQVGGELRIAVAEYSQEYQPGSIVSGVPDNPALAKYKVYKLNRFYPSPAERDAALADYQTGAVPHGAPAVSVLPDGTVGITGDQMLWCVFNDADPGVHTNNAGGTQPLGVEVQQTTFAFNRPGPLGRVVYLRYQILNKGSNLLEDMYVGLWTDPDVGGFTDDLVGCDPFRGLGFCYNAGGPDAIYGAAPPAVGVDLISERLGLRSFSKYINGTDPASPFETYNYMRGLLPDGSPIVDPTTGMTTTYFHSGDPLTGSGWLDLAAADKRMLLTSGPFTLAPGQEQEVLYAIIIGQAHNHLASLARVRCDERGVQAFAEAGFTGPEPVSGPCPVPAACQRTADDWEQQFRGGGDFSPQQLQAVASCMDEKSSLLELGGSVEAVRNLLDSSNLATPAGTARREYAALLANACATALRLPPEAPVSLRLTEGVSCTGLTATHVAQLLETAVIRVQADYVDLNPTHPRPLTGVNWGGSAFFGGADAMYNFFGTGPDPFVSPEAFPTVELRFDHSHTQLAYRYLRLERLDGSAPVIGRAYRYDGFYPVNFTCWDVTHGVQLDVAFVERAVTDDFGNLLGSAHQPPTFDFTWSPDASSLGGREYLFVVNRPYTGTPASDLAQDGVPINGPPVFSYVLWSSLRSPSDVIDDGDQFRFAFDYVPGPGVDVNMILLARQPQNDSDVQAAYGHIAQCLQGVNAPDLGCGPLPPLRARAGDDVRVECSSAEGTPVRLDGSASEAGDLTFSWSAPGIVFDDPHSATPTGRFPLGTTSVTLEVSRGPEVARDTVEVTVVDSRSPTLTVSLSPSTLWPPSHSLMDIQASVAAQDACDRAPAIALVAITSDEPDAGSSREDVPGDIQDADLGTADYDFRLRSERLGEGDGRTYTVCYEARDGSGNVAPQCATVVVPHDRRGRASLSAADGLWMVTVHGDAVMPARSVEAASVAVGLSASERVRASDKPPSYSDVDRDREEDVTFVLDGGLSAALVTGGPLYARWEAEGRGYLADIEPESVTAAPPQGLPQALWAGVWPNPARGGAVLLYALPRAGHVRLRVYDVTGHVVASVVDGWKPAGRHVASFTHGTGSQLYLYRLEWEGSTIKGRFTVLR